MFFVLRHECRSWSPTARFYPIDEWHEAIVPMTASMSRLSSKLICWFGVAGVTLTAVTFSISSRKSLALSIVRTTTNVPLFSLGDEMYITVQMTNSGSHTIWFQADAGSPRYSKFEREGIVWRQSPHSTGCSVGFEDRALAPHQGIAFEAIVDPCRACRIGVSFLEVRPAAAKRSILPEWLAKRLSFLRRERVAMTSTIRLANGCSP